MSENQLVGLAIIGSLICIAVLFRWLKSDSDRCYAQRFDVKIPGTVIWKDTAGARPFGNARFRIYGKPDLLIESDKGICALEYKSTNRAVYEGDWAQVYCAALAARGEGIPVNSVCVKVPFREFVRKLPESDDALYQLISRHVEMARQALAGKTCPPTDQIRKCYGCSMGTNCAYKAIRIKKAV